jgi:hypothetical protein
MKLIKTTYAILSSIPILLALSLYTLYYRIKTPGTYEASIPEGSDFTVVLHYKLTGLLFTVAFFSFITLIPCTVAFLGYSAWRREMIFKFPFIIYFVGLFIMLFMFRWDELHVVSWFLD